MPKSADYIRLHYGNFKATDRPLPPVSALDESGAGLKVCIERASKENEDDHD